MQEDKKDVQTKNTSTQNPDLTTTPKIEVKK